MHSRISVAAMKGKTALRKWYSSDKVASGKVFCGGKGWFPYQKCYRSICSERYSGNVESRNTTKPYCTANLKRETYWERKTQEGGCLCSGKKQQGPKHKAGLHVVSYSVSLSKMEICRVRISGISIPEFVYAQGLWDFLFRDSGSQR